MYTAQAECVGRPEPGCQARPDASDSSTLWRRGNFTSTPPRRPRRRMLPLDASDRDLMTVFAARKPLGIVASAKMDAIACGSLIAPLARIVVGQCRRARASAFKPPRDLGCCLLDIQRPSAEPNLKMVLSADLSGSLSVEREVLAAAQRGRVSTTCGNRRQERRNPGARAIRDVG